MQKGNIICRDQWFIVEVYVEYSFYHDEITLYYFKWLRNKYNVKAIDVWPMFCNSIEWCLLEVKRTNDNVKINFSCS